MRNTEEWTTGGKKERVQFKKSRIFFYCFKFKISKKYTSGNIKRKKFDM